MPCTEAGKKPSTGVCNGLDFCIYLAQISPMNRSIIDKHVANALAFYQNPSNDKAQLQALESIFINSSPVWEDTSLEEKTVIFMEILEELNERLYGDTDLCIKKLIDNYVSYGNVTHTAVLEGLTEVMTHILQGNYSLIRI